MKRILALLLCLCLALSPGALSALASEELPSDAAAPESPAEGGIPAEALPEEAPPAPDGGGQPSPALEEGEDAWNVLYYNVYPDSEDLVLMAGETVGIGGHPSRIPTWDGMSFTWHLTPDLSGDPVDPASYTIGSEDDTLSFYGYLSTVCVRLHESDGAIIDEKYVNRGAIFDVTKQLQRCVDWPAGWADENGVLFDTENTPITENIDLYAVDGSFRVTYMYGDKYLGSEGFLSPGAPKHAPASIPALDDSIGYYVITHTDITGWTDETGKAADIGAAVTGDGTLYAVAGSDGADDTWDFGWTMTSATGTLAITGEGDLKTVYASVVLPPWHCLRDSITRVVVCEGVTGLCRDFFWDLSLAETYELPSSLETLGHAAIHPTPSLRSVAVAAKDGYAFAGWVDEEGALFSSEELCAGAGYAGDLTASRLRIWAEGRFTDVSGSSWYHDAVQFCYQAELMNGISETLFDPNGSATRGQVVTVLWRLAGEPAARDSGFSDVPDGKYYSAAVAWASANGITTGYPDGTFQPNSAVTRQEFLTFLFRFTEAWAGEQPPSCDSDPLEGFADRGLVGSWAQSAECWSVATGLQEGSLDGGVLRLNPTQSIRRSEMAAFLMRYCIAIVYAGTEAVS